MHRLGGKTEVVRLTIQGKIVELACVDAVKPTAFSTFLANTMRLRATDSTVCDLGTGGGVLAICLALLGAENVVAIDHSEAACELARENVERNGVTKQVEVLRADLAEFPPANFDLLVANPPTIPIGLETPAFAAAGAQPGETFIDLLIGGLSRWMSESGRAQLAISSLVADTIVDRVLAVGLDVEAKATMIVPFRHFYLSAYSGEEIEDFAAEGRVLVEGDPRAGEVSEYVTLYEFRKADQRDRRRSDFE
jgi:methylase of polypeptide subunit release factors